MNKPKDNVRNIKGIFRSAMNGRVSGPELAVRLVTGNNQGCTRKRYVDENGKKWEAHMSSSVTVLYPSQGREVGAWEALAECTTQEREAFCPAVVGTN